MVRMPGMMNPPVFIMEASVVLPRPRSLTKLAYWIVVGAIEVGYADRDTEKRRADDPA
jgi:hypothetical protein